MQTIDQPRLPSRRWLKPALLFLATSACLALIADASHAENTAPTIAIVAGDLTDPCFSALKKGADDAALDLEFANTRKFVLERWR